MQTVYLDMTENSASIGIIGLEAQVIRAGTTVYSMPIKEKNDTYRRYAENCDIHFIFEDAIPIVTFYTIPQVDILATDSTGGLIGTVGQLSDLECDAPICYIDSQKRCFLIAQTGREFLEIANSWKSHLKPYDGVVFYSSKAEAEKELDFITFPKQEKATKEPGKF